MRRIRKAISTDSQNQVLRYQGKILTDRYLDCILGEFRTTFILLLQSPIIAALIAWRFHHAAPSPFLYFSLSLSTLWFGCTNSAREIVKEKAIFGRERLYGLNVRPYVISKLKILSLIGFLQSLLLILIVDHYVPLKGLIVVHVFNAFITTVCGIALGLLISSLVNTVHQADAWVPLVLIPQILFSPIVMPESYLSGWAFYFDKIMILRWSYDSYLELAGKNTDWVQILFNTGILFVMILIMLFFAGFALKNKRIIF